MSYQYSPGIEIHKKYGKHLFDSGAKVGHAMGFWEGKGFVSRVKKALDNMKKLPTGKKLIQAIDASGRTCHIFSGGAMTYASPADGGDQIGGFDGCCLPKNMRDFREFNIDRMVVSFREFVHNAPLASKNVADDSPDGLSRFQRTLKRMYLENVGIEHTQSSELARIVLRYESAHGGDGWEAMARRVGKPVNWLLNVSLGSQQCDDDTYYKICFLFYDYLTPGAGIDTQVRLVPSIKIGIAGVEGDAAFDYSNADAVREDIMIGHELIHAWRMMVGRRVVRDGWEEEAMTVGLWAAAGFPFTENRLRAEAGMPTRNTYRLPSYNAPFLQSKVLSGTVMEI